MNRKKLIMILDLRGQTDSELLALTDMLVNEEINWVFLDDVIKNYEPNLIKGIRKRVNKLLKEGKQ